jgi:hypothetical protein
MTNTHATDAYSTKEDLRQSFEDFYIRMEKMVGNTVGEIVGDALQIISERFDAVDRRFEQVDKRFDRMEDKLDTVTATADHHTIDIRELQRKTA